MAEHRYASQLGHYILNHLKSGSLYSALVKEDTRRGFYDYFEKLDTPIYSKKHGNMWNETKKLIINYLSKERLKELLIKSILK